MRNISFSLTWPQFLDGSKTVTRRLRWHHAAPGMQLMGCQKCQGIKPGELVRAHPLELTHVRREPLSRMIDEPAYGVEEARLEGFPHLDGPGFVAMFCQHMLATPGTQVTRLEFKHLFPHLWINQALQGIWCSDEIELHRRIASAFDLHGIPYQREVKLLDGRIDFHVLGSIGIEVKTNGSFLAATRQTLRYLTDPSITQAIILTARPMSHTGFATDASGIPVCHSLGKPVRIIELWRHAI